MSFIQDLAECAQASGKPAQAAEMTRLAVDHHSIDDPIDAVNEAIDILNKIRDACDNLPQKKGVTRRFADSIHALTCEWSGWDYE
jgi:microcompartment protein CcmL/EutN